MSERVRRDRTLGDADPRERRGAGGEDLVARRRDDEAERHLGRIVARGLPVLCLAGALAAGVAGSVGSALLVLASGTLIGTIALLWASLRTLSGDAPLPGTLEFHPARAAAENDLEEKKLRVLRALKDIESEHAVGRLDDADYKELAARYRDEAKGLMRDLDRQLGPARAKAEQAVEEYLARRRANGTNGTNRTEDRRLTCPRCGSSNEPDAAFCKRCGTGMGHDGQANRGADAET